MFIYKPAYLNLKYNQDTVKFPVSVYLKIIKDCNFRWIMCSQGEHKTGHMSLSNVKKVLTELNRLNVVSIFYTGGEPLLHPNLKEILEFGKSLGFVQILVTNGLLFNQELDSDMLKYIDFAGISLHGQEEIHNKMTQNQNSFRQTVDNINWLLEQDFKNVSINCTISQVNCSFENLKYLSDLCQKWNIQINFSRLSNIGKAVDGAIIDYSEVLRNIAKLNNKKIQTGNCIAPCAIDADVRHLVHGCGAGVSIAAIESNGDVKICASSTISLGNVFLESFRKIWRTNNKLCKFRKMEYLLPQCNVCKYLIACKGGCKAELNEEFDKTLCDVLVKDKIDKIWNELQNKKIILQFNEILINGKDSFLILGLLARRCNSNTVDLIKQIDNEKTGQEILSLYSDTDKDEVKYLICALKMDNLIE